jgi:hypothetical protein
MVSIARPGPAIASEIGAVLRAVEHMVAPGHGEGGHHRAAMSLILCGAQEHGAKEILGVRPLYIILA